MYSPRTLVVVKIRWLKDNASHKMKFYSVSNQFSWLRWCHHVWESPHALKPAHQTFLQHCLHNEWSEFWSSERRPFLNFSGKIVRHFPLPFKMCTPRSFLCQMSKFQQLKKNLIYYSDCSTLKLDKCLKTLLHQNGTIAFLTFKTA